MNKVLFASLFSAALCLNTNAGDLVRLEGPPPLVHHIYPLYAEFDDQKNIISENGIPVVAQIPSLRQKAEGGDAKSQVLLSIAIDHHLVGSTNRVEAYKWAVIAGAQGNKEAKGQIRMLELFLSEVERTQGRAAAEAFVPTARKST